MSEALNLLSGGYNFAGRYFIVRCIGTGGMGAVYEVVHAETRGRAALKVLLPRLVHRDDMRKRFLQEAQVTAQIRSDHIVRVFDAGVDDATGMPFIVMELLEGFDVDALLTRVRKLPPEHVVGLLHQAALALDKTHAAGVVHRDLKPHNLFISQRDDGAPCLKILDFGIAKLIDSNRSADRTRSAGTPVYMPPEQIRGDGDIGAPADIYALAHIAYTMLVGGPYWEREAVDLGLGPFIEAVFKGPVERPSLRAQARGTILPVAFDAWFARATAPDRAARPSSATQLVGELAQALGVAVGAVGPLTLPTKPAAQPPPQWPQSQPIPATATSGDSVIASQALPFPSQPMPSQSAPPLSSQPLGYSGQPVVPTVTTVPPGAGMLSTHGAVVSTSPAPARSARPIWFVVGALVVLGSVGAGSLLTYRLLSHDDEVQNARVRDDDDDEERSKKKKRKEEPEAAPCMFELCRPAKLDLKQPVEPLVLLEEATKMAQQMDAGARLTMISLGETVAGRVPADSSFSMVFIYRYPRPAGKPGEWAGIQVIAGQDQLMARRNPDVGLEEVVPPKCSAQQALAAAFAAGLPRDQRTTLIYQLTPGATTPKWMVNQSNGTTVWLYYVDGATCSISNTL
jgi:serine/threonine-protein kinase